MKLNCICWYDFSIWLEPGSAIQPKRKGRPGNMNPFNSNKPSTGISLSCTNLMVLEITVNNLADKKGLEFLN